MNLKPRIYVDLDGVIKNFGVPAMTRHGAFIPSEAYYPPQFQWDILGATNYIRKSRGLGPISANKFWDDFDYDFWFNLEMYDRAAEFLQMLDCIGEVFFATSPTLSSDCVAGKFDWVKKHFRDRLRNLYIGSAKEGFAKPGAILIDDRNENVDNFIACGGQAFLVPRPWNRGGCQPNPYNPIVEAIARQYQ